MAISLWRRSTAALPADPYERALGALSEAQRQAVEHGHGPLLVVSGAGSGKTRVLTTRAAFLLHNGIDPVEILVATFTNKAAEEFKQRLKALLGDQALQLRTGTLHSIGHKLLRQHGTLGGFNPNFRVIGPLQSYHRMAQAAGHLRIHRSKVRVAREWVSQYKGQMKGPTQVAAEFEGLLSEIGEEIAKLYLEYQKILQQNDEVDLDDLVCHAVLLLRYAPEVQERYGLEFVLVDEFQDTDPSQLEMVERLLTPERNLTAVGDADQCQPPGTQVLSSTGWVPIENLDPAQHRLVAYDRRGATFLGFKEGYHFRRAVRPYQGSLVRVRAGDCSTRCTPEHRWLFKWTEAAQQDDVHVVYLLRKGRSYRVGWCQLFRSDRCFHVGIRARLDEADAAWILKVHRDRAEASLWESYVATRFGLPLLPFRQPAGRTLYTQKMLDSVHGLLSDENEARAARCLEAFGLDPRFPLWDQQRALERRGGTTIGETQACNLLTGLMAVPFYHGTRWPTWQPILVEREPYEGPVHSLEVEKHPAYVADGLVTHNSIYSFRGANPAVIQEFEQRFPGARIVALGQNYRSTDRIVAAAAGLIARNQDRRLMEIWSERKAGYEVVLAPALDDLQEARIVLQQIQKIHRALAIPYREFAILYRSNWQSQVFEDLLLAAGIPYHVTGSRFFERPEIAEVTLWLRLVYRLSDLASLQRLIDWPPKRNLAIHWERIEEEQETTGIFLWERAAEGKAIPASPAGVRLIRQTYQTVGKLGEIAVVKTLPELVQALYTETGLREWWKKKDGGRAQNDELACCNLDRLLQILERFFNQPAAPTLGPFLDYVTSMTEDVPVGERDAVQLMTLHAAKGSEFTCVFLTGCEQGLLPHWQSDVAGEAGRRALEEERRLMYVGMTRAKEMLYLLWALARGTNGGGSRRNPKSQFLEELPAHHLVLWEVKRAP